MWQAPSQRIRAMAIAKKRARERNRKSIHIKQVEGDLKLSAENLEAPPTKETEVRVILNDLGSKGVGLFAARLLDVGQEVVLTIFKPRELRIHGKIAWCQEYKADSHVLSQNRFIYRIGIVFDFSESPEEEQKVKAYCNELAHEYLYGVPAYAAPALKKAA